VRSFALTPSSNAAGAPPQHPAPPELVPRCLLPPRSSCSPLAGSDAIEVERLGSVDFTGWTRPGFGANIRSLGPLHSQAPEPNIERNGSIPFHSSTKQTLSRAMVRVGRQVRVSCRHADLAGWTLRRTRDRRPPAGAREQAGPPDVYCTAWGRGAVLFVFWPFFKKNYTFILFLETICIFRP